MSDSRSATGLAGHYITQELLPGGMMLQYDSNGDNTISIIGVQDQKNSGGHVVIAAVRRHRKDEIPWASRFLASAGQYAMSKVPADVIANADGIHRQNGYKFGHPTLGMGGAAQGS